MGYKLRPGITFCRIGDRLVFLDRWNDRYFGLSDAAENALATVQAEPSHARRLIAAGVLVPSGEPLSSIDPIAHQSPGISLIDGISPAATRGSMIAAAARQLSSRAELSLRGLHRTLGRFERLRASREAKVAPSDQMGVIAAAHQGAVHVTATQTRCLPNSLAVARHLAASNYPVKLVLGVKLRPFEAHCWAELDDHIVNDRADFVHSFTPILVV